MLTRQEDDAHVSFRYFNGPTPPLRTIKQVCQHRISTEERHNDCSVCCWKENPAPPQTNFYRCKKSGVTLITMIQHAKISQRLLSCTIMYI